MFARDKRDGLSKEGSSRVALFLATDFPMCLILECNYNKGVRTNLLFEESKRKKKKEERKSEEVGLFGDLTGD